ncbi:MAG: cob(I)yrinic acid a,c-diamide adenosyltransferase [Candidatus Aramenus sp.]|nr:cob(I)yrinic acid a,c-diamide adenosyltransferase [Candidatus Aramenus sp.]
MKWFTGTGDSGKTFVPSEGNVWKYDEVVEALGDLDELNSLLGVVSSLYPEVKEILEEVQNDVFSISSEIAGFDMGFSNTEVEKLEKGIAGLDKELPPLNNFVLPGGSLPASFLHLSRAVCRRAERSVVKLYAQGKAKEVHVKYLNRLSSLLFVLALWVNLKTGHNNVVWKGRAHK